MTTAVTAERRFWQQADARGLQTAGLLGLLPALQLGLAMLAPLDALLIFDVWSPIWICELGAALAPPALLAMWTVFGPQRASVRLPLTWWLAAAMYVALLYGERRVDGPGELSFVYLTAWLIAFVVIQLPLWLLRAIRGWRLELCTDLYPFVADAQSGQRPAKGVAQFSLRSLLGWMMASAVLLALMRHSMGNAVPDVKEVVSTLPSIGIGALLIALAGLPVLPLAWIVLAAGRRSVLRLVLSTLLVVGLVGGVPLFSSFSGSQPDWQPLAFLEAGVLANAAASLAVIAACGYRLERRPRGATETVAPGAQVPNATDRGPLSRTRFALGFAPLAAIATALACAAPERLEEWRKQSFVEEWEPRGVELAFNDDGSIGGVECQSPTLISDETLRRIAALDRLQELNLTGTQIDDRQLALLAGLAELRELGLCTCNVTDAGLKHIARFRKLETLNLSNTRVTDAGLRQLASLPALESLDLQITEVTDEGLLALARCPALASLDVSLTAVSGIAADRFCSVRPDVELEFGSCDEQLDDWFGNLARGWQDYESLTGRSAIITRFDEIPLKRIHLRGTKIISRTVCHLTDEALLFLAEKTKLEELDLRETAITDAGLQHLAKLTHLKRLDLRETTISQPALARLAESLPDCEILAPR